MIDVLNEYFKERYKRWDIIIPIEDIKNKSSGYISKSGWLIQYCFGVENEIEYFDFFSTHRMTGDNHVRIYENGETKSLPVFKIGYLVDCADPEPIKSQKLKEQGKEAVDKYNKEVAELLLNKGFNKFTINMTLNAGLIEE